MSARQLTDQEIHEFLSEYPDVEQLVNIHTDKYLRQGHTSTWDQILAAQADNPTLWPIPPRGIHVADANGFGDVIIYPDAHGTLHYVVTDNKSLVEEIDKPFYESDPEYFELVVDIARKYEEAFEGAGKGALDLAKKLDPTTIVIGGLVVLAILYGPSRRR